MAENWLPLPLDKPFFANLDQDAVVGAQTAIENGFINEQGGHTRFPGLKEFATLGDNGRVYMNDLSGDLIAATSKGRVYRLDRAGNVEPINGVAVSGGKRVIFQKTDRELLMAAGGPIVRLRDKKTELLSNAAPLSTHVGWIDGYTIAVEINSGEFFYDEGTNTWDPLNIFAANGSPDNINSLLVTPYRELMIGGAESVEQFERLPTGSVPFFKRWAIGDGVKFPYVQIFADNAMWAINKYTELVRFSGQQSTSEGDQIGKLLESIDDWTDAWMGGYPDRACHIIGQKFLIIQAPRATNPYGTKGVTLLFDYKNKRFSNLYGWDDQAGVPACWPGWSHWTHWSKVFVGGEGKIYTLEPGYYRHGTGLQRWLVRTSHFSVGSGMTIQNLRLQVTRGGGSSTAACEIRARCARNGGAVGPGFCRSLGKAGERDRFIYFGSFGSGSSVMFEFSSADDCAIDLTKAEVLATALGH
jgi:hypothetical protein